MQKMNQELKIKIIVRPVNKPEFIETFEFRYQHLIDQFVEDLYEAYGNNTVILYGVC